MARKSVYLQCYVLMLLSLCISVCPLFLLFFCLFLANKRVIIIIIIKQEDNEWRIVKD